MIQPIGHFVFAGFASDTDNVRHDTACDFGAIEAALREAGARPLNRRRRGRRRPCPQRHDEGCRLGSVRVIETVGSRSGAVRRSGLSHGLQRRLALFDNRAGMLAEWDAGMPVALAVDVDFSGLWTDDELAEIFARNESPDVALTEYDESAAELVACNACPECGHRYQT